MAPNHGGVNARVLTSFVIQVQTLRMPLVADLSVSRTTIRPPRSRAICSLLRGSKALTPCRGMPYPWYNNRASKAAELDEGVQPILDLIALIPPLEVVLFQTRSAQDSWRRVTRRAPNLVRERGLT